MNSKIKAFFKQMDLQMLVIPSIIHVLVFCFIPLYGLLMAFQEFNLGDFPGFSQWAGLKQFTYLFRDPNFGKVMRNTLVVSALKLLINFPVPILFAVLVNEINRQFFKKTVQTISYLPHFISWVVASTLMFDFLSTDNGAVNSLLMSLKLIDAPIPFFMRGEMFWGILVVTDLWKEVGWNAIIFIAAITGVDSQMYEAAAIDGAGRLQRIWYITLATIKPTIVLLFIFTVGGVLNANFDQIMTLTNQMGNSMLREYADVIDTYIYRVGLREGRYSFAAAAGLFKSAINFILLLVANYIAGKLGESSLF